MKKELHQSIIDKNIISRALFTIFFSVIGGYIAYGLSKRLTEFTVPLFVIICTFFIIATIWIQRWHVYRFLTPALIVLIILSGFPVIYTVYIAFTNLDADHSMQKNIAIETLLNAKWHIVQESDPIYGEFLISEDKISKYMEEYDEVIGEFDEKMDAKLEEETTEEEEDALWNKRDALEAKLLSKYLKGLTRKDFLFLFYNEEKISDINDNFKVYCYDGSNSTKENGDFIIKEIDKQEIDKLSEEKVLLGEPVLERDDVEYNEDFDISRLKKLYRELQTNSLVLNDDKYYIEFDNKFIHKMPLYIRNPDKNSDYLQLEVVDGVSGGYTGLVFEDDYTGNFVFTEDDSKPKHWQEYRISGGGIRQTLLSFLFFTENTYRFFEGKKREWGFYEKANKYINRDYTIFLKDKPTQEVDLDDLKFRVKEYNKLIIQFNREFRKLYAQEFKEGHFNPFPTFPAGKKIRIKKIDKSNIHKKKEVSPGYTVNTGIRNFRNAMKSDIMKYAFLPIFGWTLIWALLSTVTAFGAGLFIAIILNQKGLKGKRFYRTVFILPYAIPMSLSVMMWGSFFNDDFGVINNFFNLSIPWFSNSFTVKVACLIISLWIHFPYFMVIAMGALQSIDKSLYEVASVDGASKFQQLTRITFPLILMSMGPMLAGFFAYSFNNFTLIYLMRTYDNVILATLIYSMGRGGAFSFASAVAVISFFLIGPITLIQFKMSGVFRDVKS